MNIIKVADEFRKNPMSLIDGGYDVTIVWEDGTKYTYDKVKKPSNYVSHIAKKVSKHGLMVEVLVDGSIVWKRGSSSETSSSWKDFLAM